MNVRARAMLSVVALAAALAPTPSLATSAGTVSYNLYTQQTTPYEAGGYVGTLRLQITPDGIVGGTYIPEDGRITTVTGGLEGTKIWLQLRDRPRSYIYQGTFVDGKLTATTFGRDLKVWELDGTPAKH